MEFMPKKKLGFGLMRMPLNDKANDADVDVAQVCEMVDMFIDRGFTYFDTAWMYNGFNSENTVKKVLTERHSRDSFTLATKLHAGFFNSLSDRDKMLEAQLKKTGAGYFDYYLLHGIDAGCIDHFEKYDCYNWIQQKKKEGVIRHIGFSFHDTPELLDKILTDHPEMEFVQLQLNYLDWESEWIQARACHEVAVKHGKPIIVMEPVKGGTLANLPSEAETLFKNVDPNMSPSSWAIRFAASLENVMVVLSGMSSVSQVNDNTAFMSEFVPLTEEEKQLCFKVGDIINSKIAIPCTGCSYCTEGCPRKIPIPKYFSLYNENMRENMEEKGWTINYSNYMHLVENGFGKASSCLACGRCEQVCPQHLPIIDTLKDVADHFE